MHTRRVRVPSKLKPYYTNQETTTLQDFLQSANSSGYAGTTNPTNKKGCFIATAALDSEIHPHVQFLREYRDNVLLKSSHRKQFEKMLDWYYSCSPLVAEAMNKDKNLKRVIKYMIVYPIVLSLKILVKLLGNELKD